MPFTGTHSSVVTKIDGVALFRDLSPPNHVLSNDMQINFVGALLPQHLEMSHDFFDLWIDFS